MSKTPSQTYMIAGEHVAAKVIEGEAIILDLKSGVYYSLSGAGGAAWEYLAAGHSLQQIQEALASGFEASEATLSADLSALVDVLLERNLLVTSNVHANGAPTVTAGGQPYQPMALESFHDISEFLALDPPNPGVFEGAW